MHTNEIDAQRVALVTGAGTGIAGRWRWNSWLRVTAWCWRAGAANCLRKRARRRAKTACARW